MKNDFYFSWLDRNVEILGGRHEETGKCRELHPPSDISQKVKHNNNPTNKDKVLIMFLSFSYRLRVECLLLKAEFEANMGFLEPSIEAMLTAGEGKKTLT